MRKDSGFAVSDRIRLAVRGSDELEAAVRAHSKWIANEVLAVGIEVGVGIEKFHAAQSVDIDGQPASIAIERAG
jgi:hypothetical protein